MPDLPFNSGFPQPEVWIDRDQHTHQHTPMRGMTTKSLSSLCQSILPDHYRQTVQQIVQVQQFLHLQLPASLAPAVTVINVTNDVITVAVADPQIANYLRLHRHELGQQINETFNNNQTLRIKTMPDSLLQVNAPSAAEAPEKVSLQVADTIVRHAQWIEDENLRQALVSLAESLKALNEAEVICASEYNDRRINYDR